MEWQPLADARPGPAAGNRGFGVQLSNLELSIVLTAPGSAVQRAGTPLVIYGVVDMPHGVDVVAAEHSHGAVVIT